MKLGEQLGIPEDVFRYSPDPALILPTCRIGVEFEFEKVNTFLPEDQAWTRYWTIKRDGSLHDAGMEFVFAQPWFGADAVNAIKFLTEHAKAKKYKATIRTGLHVHIDCRDMNLDELARLCTLYALFERAIYRYVGNNRDENVFCLPWYKADAVSLIANNIVSDNQFRSLKDRASDLAEEKYGGLNLDSLARFGSVEFRHALTTTDFDWIIRWINICLSFKKAACEIKQTPMEIIHSLSGQGVEAFAARVFGDLFKYLYYPELENDVWMYGVETALQVCPEPTIAVNETVDRAELSWFNPDVVSVVNKHKPVNKSFSAFIREKRPAKKPQPAAQAKVAGLAGMVVDDPFVMPEPWPDFNANQGRRVFEWIINAVPTRRDENDF